MPVANTRLQITAIDTQVQDYQVLEQAAREAGLEVILPSGQKDGGQQLANHRDIAKLKKIAYRMPVLGCATSGYTI